jgi:hypothetical protein
MVFRAFHHRNEVGDLEQLDFEKTLKEGSTLVFGVGCLGYIDTIDEFTDFYSYGTVEDFKKNLTKGFSLLDLD